MTVETIIEILAECLNQERGYQDGDSDGETDFGRTLIDAIKFLDERRLAGANL